MWTWIKAFMTKIGTFIKPLVMKLMSQTGMMICSVAVLAVKETAASSATTWQDKLNVGVDSAIKQLEAQGLKLGVDFFLNEVIAAITATIAKNYEDSK